MEESLQSYSKAFTSAVFPTVKRNAIGMLFLFFN